MAPRAGFEPATDRLTVDCSTAELSRNTIETLHKFVRGMSYNKCIFLIPAKISTKTPKKAKNYNSCQLAA